MNRFALVFLCFVSTAFADIESLTFIERVNIPGEDQRAGKITLSIDSDEFPRATPRRPVHIRVGLDDGVTLSQTLVGPREPAILIPMVVLGPDALMVAPANAVRIVRWREGESAFWLRITAPTDSWLEVDGEVQAPSEEHKVLLVIGEDAAGSRNLFEDNYLDGTANLPATRQQGMDVGTEIVLDLDAGSGFFINYEPSAFKGRRGNIRTRVPEHAINVGRSLDLVFYGDFIIAAALFP